MWLLYRECSMLSLCSLFSHVYYAEVQCVLLNRLHVVHEALHSNCTVNDITKWKTVGLVKFVIIFFSLTHYLHTYDMLNNMTAGAGHSLFFFFRISSSLIFNSGCWSHALAMAQLRRGQLRMVVDIVGSC